MALVTGGAGYIGGHTCVELFAAGYDVVVLDNLSNSSADAVAAVGKIAGQPPSLEVGDLRDGNFLKDVFDRNAFDVVLHFAGLKAVGESVDRPLLYYDNNVTGTISLLRAMDDAGCRSLVFSSSATVYGEPRRVPITEDEELQPTNPYGRTKLHIERILRDASQSDPRWQISALRYFNPVGAHPSGLIGEDPKGVPNNLVPYIAKVATGRFPKLRVFGNDYPTPDGTGIRDYIHVSDLARGHVQALQRLSNQTGFEAHNLGTGVGYSVLEVLRAFEEVSGEAIPFEVVNRRSGDIAVCVADPSRAKRDFAWRTEHGLSQMCEDTWRWESTHPSGFSREKKPA